MKRILLTAVIVLSACATPEQRAERESKYLAELEDRCLKMGFKTETEGMANCKLSLSNADRQAEGQAAAVRAANRATVREATKLK